MSIKNLVKDRHQDESPDVVNQFLSKANDNGLRLITVKDVSIPYTKDGSTQVYFEKVTRYFFEEML